MVRQLPPEICLEIKLRIASPQSHIAFSQTCQTSRSAYEKDIGWKLLCRSLGIGRSLSYKKTTWREIFHRVVGHQKACTLPRCFRYGVPPKKAIGDLLTTKQETLNHFHYFHPAQGAQAGEEPTKCEDEDMFEEPCGCLPSTEVKTEAFKKEDKTSAPTPRSKPNLLPLAERNAANVPHQPELHPYIETCNLLNFRLFIDDFLITAPGYCGIETTCESIRQQTGWEGFDWEDEDEDGYVNLDHLGDHVLLENAFASNPPVTQLKIRLSFLQTIVKNMNGVTISDVTAQLRRFLDHVASEANFTALFRTDMLLGMMMDTSGVETRWDLLSAISDTCGGCGYFTLNAMLAMERRSGESMIVFHPLN
ncbi:hypothetical protein P7C73_g930, partial [Tremellales sp. Uapishka_1]